MDERLTITGMAVALGDVRTLDAFAHVLYSGQTMVRENTLSFEDLVGVADKALFDAGIPPGARVTVIVVGDSTRATALREAVTARWRLDGPAPSLTDVEATSPFAALAHLRAGLASDTALLLAVGDAGAAAVVLTADPQARGYAQLQALACGEASTAASQCVESWRDAGVVPADVGYLEALHPLRSDDPATAGLLSAYGRAESTLTCAVGTLASEPGPALALAGLIKAALAVHRRTLPAFPAWEGPDVPARWRGAPFYVASTPRPWLVKPEGEGRVAAVSGGGEEGYTHVLLGEAARRRAEPVVRAQLGASRAYLLPLVGDDRAALEAAVASLQTRLDAGASLAVLSDAAIRRCAEADNAAYALVLVAHDVEELQDELGYAVKGLERAFEAGRPWSTPHGSYFTAEPLGGGGLTFVYPGAFNSYLDMGRELLQHFPGLHDRVRDIISDVGRSLWEELLYPRSLTPLTEAERKERSARLSGNPIAMIESGISLSILYTLILREIFAVRPQAALGYSLGEISMLWANGVWQDGDAGSAAWRTSPLFKHRLFGPKDAVREHWGLEGGDDDFWASYILKARPDDVRACVADEPHAYLSIINTPREVVVAGEREACRRVIEASGARHPLPMPFDAVIHNEAMMSEYPEFVDLYTNKTDPDSELTYYSAFDYAPLTLTSSALARATARMTCSPVDFPRLVETAYADGARLFVELGPLSTCSRWVERILRGKPHAVVPIDKSRREGFAGVLAALAVLISHRVPLDLSPLVAAPERSFDPAVLAREPLPDAVPVTTPARGTSEPVGVGVEMEVGRAVAPSLAAVSGSDLYRDLQQHAARVAQGHLAFLETQRSVIRQTGTLLQLQIDASRRLLGGAEGDDSMSTVHVAPLYTRAQIVEFATGDPVACFGPAYAVYRGRRMPRLPNGALRLVDRVMAIEGERGEIRVGTRLRSEVDVPFDAWYLRENAYPTVPYAVLMEMALQPCGFLSSYMGSMLSHPEVEFYFRNLDGEGALLAEPDLRGKTVTNRVELLSSSKVRGIILQHYAFELSCEGRPFYRGQSSFGYFTPQALRKQQGLDGGRMTRPWYQEKRRNCLPVDARPFFRTGRRRRYERLASGKLRLIDRAQICPDGGEHRSGYVHADVNVRPDDWFFACHFYQDPVMPGSLGVGAVLQALQLFALEQGLGTHLKNPRFGPLVGPTANWKYRGQVTQEKNDVHLEAHVKEIDVRKDAVMLVADANVWENGLRIYELQDVGVRLLEA